MMAGPFKPCAVDGCNGDARAKNRGRRGYCNKHYLRLMRNGDPLAGDRERARSGQPLQWLKDHVEHKSDECLTWPFGTYPNGYGFVVVDGVKRGSHRLMCEIAHGAPDASDLQASHGCGNRLCLNPKHLRWDTISGNHADKLLHDTHQRGERCGKAKLTESEVLAIRALIGVESQRSIAEKFGVAQRTIHDIAHRRSWYWLD